MAIISQETWDNMPEKEKKKIITEYQEYAILCEEGVDKFDRNDNLSRKRELEQLFGKHNLQSKPKIRTWADCQEMNEDSHFYMRIVDNLELPDKIYSKCIAILKIAKLIELGYGGIVTDEEWRNEDINKFSIVCEENRLSISCLPEERHFISFHYVQQAEEFISYSENVELVKQYYMI